MIIVEKTINQFDTAINITLCAMMPGPGNHDVWDKYR
jgi:hypothetical protein